MKARNCIHIAWLFCIVLISGCASIDDAAEFRKEHIKSYREELERRKELLKGPLTLERCIQLALVYNYDSKKAEISQELAKLNRNSSFSTFLPSITGNVGITHWDKEQTMSGTQIADATYRDASLKITVPLLIPSAYFMFQNSRMGMDVAKLQAHYTRQLVILQTSYNYYQILITQRRIRTLETQVEASKSLAERLTGLTKAGLVRKWERDEASFILTQRTNQLNDAKRQLQTDKASLLKMMGMNVIENIEIIDVKDKLPIPQDGLNAMILTALESHPSLAIADQNTVMAENTVRGSLAAFLPVVSAVGNATWTSDSFSDRGHALYGSLIGSMDLFQGFRKVWDYKSAKFKREAAKLDREATTLSVMLEVVKARNTLVQADEVYKVYEDQYAFLKDKYSDYVGRCKAGLEPVYKLLDAQAEMFLSETQLATAFYNTYIAKLQLDLAMGTVKVEMPKTPLQDVKTK